MLKMSPLNQQEAPQFIISHEFGLLIVLGNLHPGNLFSGNQYPGNLFLGNLCPGIQCLCNLCPGNLYSGYLYPGNLYVWVICIRVISIWVISIRIIFIQVISILVVCIRTFSLWVICIWVINICTICIRDWYDDVCVVLSLYCTVAHKCQLCVFLCLHTHSLTHLLSHSYLFFSQSASYKCKYFPQLTQLGYAKIGANTVIWHANKCNQ